jgi:hypothetical protein
LVQLADQFKFLPFPQERKYYDPSFIFYKRNLSQHTYTCRIRIFKIRRILSVEFIKEGALRDMMCGFCKTINLQSNLVRELLARVERGKGRGEGRKRRGSRIWLADIFGSLMIY